MKRRYVVCREYATCLSDNVSDWSVYDRTSKDPDERPEAVFASRADAIRWRDEKNRVFKLKAGKEGDVLSLLSCKNIHLGPDLTNGTWLASFVALDKVRKVNYTRPGGLARGKTPAEALDKLLLGETVSRD